MKESICKNYEEPPLMLNAKQIGAAMGIKSKDTVMKYVRGLEEKVLVRPVDFVFFTMLCLF